jgi:glycosyltransferase involved in cell wall biosynthesis
VLNKKRPAYQMVLCGPMIGGFESTVKKMAAEHPDFLLLKSPVSGEKVPQLYEDIDVSFAFSLPSNLKYRHYGLNIKVYESLATGTPVVLAKSAENHVLLEHVSAAVFMDSLAPDDIAQKLTDLCGDRENLSRIGAKGRSFIKSEFNWNKYSEGYLRYICAYGKFRKR